MERMIGIRTEVIENVLVIHATKGFNPEVALIVLDRLLKTSGQLTGVLINDLESGYVPDEHHISKLLKKIIDSSFIENKLAIVTRTKSQGAMAKFIINGIEPSGIKAAYFNSLNQAFTWIKKD